LRKVVLACYEVDIELLSLYIRKRSSMATIKLYRLRERPNFYRHVGGLARKGGLDRDTKRAISLDDVNVDMIEILRLALEVAKDIQRVEEKAGEYLEDMANEKAMPMNELTTQFRMSRLTWMNPLSTPVLSGMSWVRVQRGLHRERRGNGNTMHVDGGSTICIMQFLRGNCLGNARETDEDSNMAECRSCGVLGNNETWAQQGDQDGKHDSEVLIQEVKQVQAARPRAR
jgi:hypothetical protein